jgi:hypothetical protein
LHCLFLSSKYSHSHVLSQHTIQLQVKQIGVHIRLWNYLIPQTLGYFKFLPRTLVADIDKKDLFALVRSEPQGKKGEEGREIFLFNFQFSIFQFFIFQFSCKINNNFEFFISIPYCHFFIFHLFILFLFLFFCFLFYFFHFIFSFIEI